MMLTGAYSGHITRGNNTFADLLFGKGEGKKEQEGKE